MRHERPKSMKFVSNAAAMIQRNEAVKAGLGTADNIMNEDKSKSFQDNGLVRIYRDKSSLLSQCAPKPMRFTYKELKV